MGLAESPLDAPKLIELCGSPDEDIAVGAIYTLSLCGDEALPILPFLLREAEIGSPEWSPLKYASRLALEVLCDESPVVQQWLIHRSRVHWFREGE